MKFFMQGMRRSATTVVYDLLSQDDRLDLYYEPYSVHGKVEMGGGSGMQEIDHMAKIYELRDAFVAAHPEYGIEPGDLNYGAPRDAALELETDLAPWAAEYMFELLSRSDHIAIKFTRMYRKMHALKEIAPDARMSLLLRHPQEVVASYLYGKGLQRSDKIPTADVFFSRTSNINPWNARRFFEEIVAAEGWHHLEGSPDWIVFLTVWKYTFDYSMAEGRAAFGDALLVQTHEDLVAQPEAGVLELYDHMGLEPSETAVEWAVTNLRKSRKRAYHEDPRWIEGYEKVGMMDSLAAAGYDPVLGGGEMA
jgi:hypothetical protein